MFKQFWNYIISLFGIKKTITSTKQQEENQNYTSEYLDISDINFTAIFANKLATLATADSTVEIPSDNKRAALLSDSVKDVWSKIKKITASSLAVGGCLIIPYVKDGKILYNIVKQDRLVINSRSGETITNATVIADSITINNINYFRLVNYAVIENTLYITNRTVTEHGTAGTVDEWADIPDIAVSNVDRVLFGFIKSPVDNRKSSDNYGAPITYGCKKIIEDIKDCLKQIKEEFELKQVRLITDERNFDKDPKTGKPILKSKLFMTGYNENGDLFNIFDPAIRDSSYHARLEKLFELLEKQVGTSKGILTSPETHGATATEIKAAISDTFALVCDIRKSIEKGLNDYIYACDVLANYYNLTPPGNYNIQYNWSYSMTESVTETWRQMKDLQSIGALSKAELRAWQTGENIEDAQKAVDEITAREPGLDTLLGLDEGLSTPRAQ